ncbi:MAG: hypothetical protein Q8O34_01325 [Rhodocyclaceae bacterium]|nr:hypothetical protein [Rhodocyclaceae bacterium]
MIGDQADGLRRLFGAQDVRYTTVAVAARTEDVTRAYAMIKRMAREHGKHHGFRIVVTQARSHEEAQAIFENMRRVAHEHLGVRLDYLSAIIAPPPTTPRSGVLPPGGETLGAARRVSLEPAAKDSVL